MTQTLNRARADSWRLNQRREIRKQIAARDALTDKLQIQQGRIAKLDREADAAADTHRVTTAPIQDELNRIESRITDLIADRQPAEPGLEERRSELLDQLEAANEQLSDAVERINRLKRPLVVEVQRLGNEMAQGAALENRLTHPDIGNPRLLTEKFVAQQAEKWATVRLEAAQQHLAECEQMAKNARQRGDEDAAQLWQERAPKWREEAKAAGATFSEAHAAAEAAHWAVVNE